MTPIGEQAAIRSDGVRLERIYSGVLALPGITLLIL